MKRAQETLENPPSRNGLTNEAMAAYTELAKRAVATYEKTGNAAGAALQNARIEILNRISNLTK